jgi:hypothetical protein
MIAIARRDRTIHIPWWKVVTVVANGCREWIVTDALAVVVDFLAISDSQSPVVHRLMQLLLDDYLG